MEMYRSNNRLLISTLTIVNIYPLSQILKEFLTINVDKIFNRFTICLTLLVYFYYKLNYKIKILRRMFVCRIIRYNIYPTDHVVGYEVINILLLKRILKRYL